MFISRTRPVRLAAATAVADLKSRLDGDIRVIGSRNLIQTLLKHDLVDTFHLVIAPIVLGTGKRLFGDGARPAGYRLTSATVITAGVAVHNYERAGAVEYRPAPPA